MTNYYSTNARDSTPAADLKTFRHVLLQGQAPDRGLYMPKVIPKITNEVISTFQDLEYWEIASIVTHHLLSVGGKEEVPKEKLRELCKSAYDYNIPLIELKKNRHVMRLDQGPTSSFKDFAARLMARLMQYFLQQTGDNLVILTATSGDTGGAVADAFYGMDNIDIIVLYPKKEISERQRRQMTTLGKNVMAISIDAKFDDCQALVKEAFADSDLSEIPLSSANSINFGRLLPQAVYYFYAFSRIVKDPSSEIIFSVPSGNFGDLMGGILAYNMGLNVNRFIVAVNENDEFPKFLETGEYSKISPSVNCLSSAMNVGHPSNLARLVDKYGGQLDHVGNLLKAPNMEEMRKDMWSTSISDTVTKSTISSVYKEFNFIMEPHGAVAWAATESFDKDINNALDIPIVAFETADPAKFPDQIRELTNVDPEIPKTIIEQGKKEEFLNSIENEYSEFKSLLKKKYL